MPKLGQLALVLAFGFALGASVALLPHQSDRAIDAQRAEATRVAIERELVLRQSLERSARLGRDLASRLEGSESRSRALAAGLIEMAGRGDRVVVGIDRSSEGLERTIAILDRLIEARSRGENGQ